MKLDHYDIAILKVLQQNGRISKRELADEIGLSVTPCWVRMKKLEEMGYIQSYGAKINLERITRFCHVTTMVGLKSHHANAFERFEAAVTSTPEIIQCDAVVGEIDYILKFITHDINHYQNLIECLLEKDIGIQTYYSHVRSKVIKNDSGEVLNLLLKDISNKV